MPKGDRLLSFADSDYQYDSLGNQIRERGIGVQTERAFNAFNQLTSFSKEGVLTQYDKQNRLTQQSFGNQIELKQTFDVFHRLTQQTLTHPAQRIYDQCDYQYDAIDQLISRQSHTQQTTQEQEQEQEENALTQAKQEAFEYNAIGQLIKESVAYTREQETKNKYTQSKRTEFAWDSVGNPISQRTVIDSVENDKTDSEPNQPKTQARETEDAISGSFLHCQ